MTSDLRFERTLRELLSAAAVDPALRRRLKIRAQRTLAEWGIETTERSISFVEPGERPERPRLGEAILELPPLLAALPDESLDAAAGGWDAARDQAVGSLEPTADWRASDPWAS